MNRWRTTYFSMNDYLKKWCCLIIFNIDKKNIDAINSIASSIDCSKHFYCDKEIIAHYKLNSDQIQKYVPHGDEFGTQIKNAFENAFSKGFRKVVLIKNNFDQLQPSQIIEAFNCLKMIEFCIGPKSNGDYYLIGMNYFEPLLFINKQWNSPTLLKETIKDIGKLKLALYKLSTIQTLENATTLNN